MPVLKIQVKLMERITLDKIPLNSEVIIDSIDCVDGIKNRILDMGITEGEKIIPILKSPFGDPIAYLSKGTVIALRKSDCNKISVHY